MSDTLYELLGVTPDAAPEEIRAAYRKLCRAYHPDGGGTAAMFRQLQNAYEELSDPQRRVVYDSSFQEPTRTAGQCETPREASESPQPGSSGENAYQPPPAPSYGQGFVPPFSRGSASGVPRQLVSTWDRFNEGWARGVKSFGALARGHRLHHEEVVTVVWTTCSIVALVLVAGLAEATHGLVVLVAVGIGIVLWRRRQSRTREPSG